MTDEATGHPMKATANFHRIATILGGLALTDVQGATVELDDGCEDLVRDFLRAKEERRRIFLIGNGGSASIAGHMQMDLCNRLEARAQVFNDAPVLTALANDRGYDHAFARLIELFLDAGDWLIAISSSGRSPNILSAVAVARARGGRIVTFSGFSPGNPLRSLGDFNFWVDSEAYGEVEVAHHALGHFLTDRAAEMASASPARV